MADTNYWKGDPASGVKYFIATPVYDSPSARYTSSLQESCAELAKQWINYSYLLLSGNCHVDDARNEIVKTFLASDCTDLVFLDADVSWTPKELLQLLSRTKWLVGGVYGYRSNKEGMPVRLLDKSPRDDGLLEVEGLPTGFMKIRRQVFDLLKPHCESYQDTTLFFQRTLIQGTRWGGDLNFCRLLRSLGGSVYADMEMRLGHTGRTVFTDSLGAFLRRKDGTTLPRVVAKVRDGTESLSDLQEAIDCLDNKWGADVATLAACVRLARKAKGMIIESGSGLSTVLMAAASGRTVYCLEHSEIYAQKLREMARLVGVGNIGLCVCEIKDGFYDLTGKNLPDKFALGFNDGPPRMLGDRMKFFDHFSPDTVVCDDANDPAYLAKLKAMHWTVDVLNERTAILRG